MKRKVTKNEFKTIKNELENIKGYIEDISTINGTLTEYIGDLGNEWHTELGYDKINEIIGKIDNVLGSDTLGNIASCCSNIVSTVNQIVPVDDQTLQDEWDALCSAWNTYYQQCNYANEHLGVRMPQQPPELTPKTQGELDALKIAEQLDEFPSVSFETGKVVALADKDFLIRDTTESTLLNIKGECSKISSNLLNIKDSADRMTCGEITQYSTAISNTANTASENLSSYILTFDDIINLVLKTDSDIYTLTGGSYDLDDIDDDKKFDYYYYFLDEKEVEEFKNDVMSFYNKYIKDDDSDRWSTLTEYDDLIKKYPGLNSAIILSMIEENKKDETNEEESSDSEKNDTSAGGTSNNIGYIPPSNPSGGGTNPSPTQQPDPLPAVKPEETQPETPPTENPEEKPSETPEEKPPEETPPTDDPGTTEPEPEIGGESDWEAVPDDEGEVPEPEIDTGEDTFTPPEETGDSNVTEPNADGTEPIPDANGDVQQPEVGDTGTVEGDTTNPAPEEGNPLPDANGDVQPPETTDPGTIEGDTINPAPEEEPLTDDNNHVEIPDIGEGENVSTAPTTETGDVTSDVTSAVTDTVTESTTDTGVAELNSNVLENDPSMENMMTSGDTSSLYDLSLDNVDPLDVNPVIDDFDFDDMMEGIDDKIGFSKVEIPKPDGSIPVPTDPTITDM